VKKIPLPQLLALRRLPSLFLLATVGTSVWCGGLLAQTNKKPPPYGFEFQGSTDNSAVWLKMDSVAEVAQGVRVGTFLQNTAIDAQFTDGQEIGLRSIQIQIKVNCADGAYIEIAEAHFTEEFAKGEQIWASKPNGTNMALLTKEYLPMGSMMHRVVNSICSQNLAKSWA
jgi:hypothetical protein